MKVNIAGLTLIELIVVITIITLLAVVGLPSYNTYLVESRRNDASIAMRQNQQIIENYKYENNILPTSGEVTLITTTPAGFYTIAYDRISDDRYLMTATAVDGKSQENDTGCTVMYLSSEMDDVFPIQCH